MDLMNMNIMHKMNLNNMNMNNMNIMNNMGMNNINTNDGLMSNEGELETDNQNNQIDKQNLIINDIKKRFKNLNQKLSIIENDNNHLKKQLMIEKNKNKNILPDNRIILENSINEGKKLIDDVQKKNAKLKEKLNDLETQNNSLNYQLIDANQKIKRLESDSKQKENDNNNNNNGNNNQDNSNEINKLKNLIDEHEKNIAKLSFDNKKLLEKMENMKKEYKEEKKLMINYKNSEIKSHIQVIEKYKQFFKNNNINENMINNRMNLNGNNNLDYEKLMIELKNKDKIIKSLNLKINKCVDEYKNVIEVNSLSEQHSKEYQKLNEKLFNEKNELLKQNENLKRAISSFTNQMNEANNIYKNKAYQNNKYINDLINKLQEYKKKVITLKKKICELHEIIDKLKNNKYQRSTNNSNYNSYLDKHPIPSTPSQIPKITVMNNQGSQYYSSNTASIGFKNGNIMMNNVSRPFDNNIRSRSNYVENKNGMSSDGLEIKQKKSLENYRKFLSQLEQNMPNAKP